MMLGSHLQNLSKLDQNKILKLLIKKFLYFYKRFSRRVVAKIQNSTKFHKSFNTNGRHRVSASMPTAGFVTPVADGAGVIPQ